MQLNCVHFGNHIAAAQLPNSSLITLINRFKFGNIQSERWILGNFCQFTS